MVRLFIILLILQSAGSAYAQNAPMIVLQPGSRTNDAGTTVELGISVSGSEPFSYRWQMDGADIAPDASIVGITTAMLVISNAQAFHGGAYTVIVTNSSGSVTSEIATLTVI